MAEVFKRIPLMLMAYDLIDEDNYVSWARCSIILDDLGIELCGCSTWLIDVPDDWTLTWIRKSKDYVYGIWVYKALDIWKGYYRVKKSLVSYMKPWTEARNNKYMKYHSKLTYQLSFWNVSRKVDYHAGGKWFIHGPKRRKENQLLSLKHPCWLSLV